MFIHQISRFAFISSLLLPLCFLHSCKQDDSDSDDAPTTPTGDSDGSSDDADGGEDGGSANSEGPTLAGTLAISQATHVYVVSPESSEQNLIAVGEDNTFEVELEPGSPHSLAIIDTSKSGAEMLVGRFAIGTLDSVATTSTDTTREISIGTLAISTSLTGDDAVITSDQSTEDLHEAMGLSEKGAEILGEVDDTIKQFNNPDIDGNGVVDSTENELFRLDFHNRFGLVDGNGDNYEADDMKNTFLPDTTSVRYSSTGIVPEFDVPSEAFSWTFSTETTLHSNNCINGPQAGENLPANTECTVEINPNDSLYGSVNVEIEPPTGTYILKVGSNTYTWPNISFGDLTSGEGFLALFIRYDVDSGNKLQGISYKLMIKTGDKYELATQEAVDLIVKPDTLRFSIKIDGSDDSKSFGASPTLAPEGTFNLSDLTANDISGIDLSEIQDGIDFERVKENPGFSYDDKFGMRYFF